ncbi:MAG: hypothetical protein RJA77_1021 [Pseudomonadota bacterium]|jgi:3-dehydroquinate synthase
MTGPIQARVTTLSVALGDRQYPIQIGQGLLGQPEVWRPLIRSRQVAIVTNTTVGPLYLETLQSALASMGLEPLIIELPDGEVYKTFASLQVIFDRLMEARMERKATLIALGGGVVGDMAGFAAACYQRGMPFIQVPTTLLSQVDSSVGGKTAVNHPLGKNMIGAFYQPQAVVIDMNVLSTLPDRELSAGLAEVIKMGCILDIGFFEWLEGHMDALRARDPQALAVAIERSCALKAQVVAEDERESTGRRALLNFGHTFGHAIEAGLGFGAWLHGEAVGCGMVMACHLSQQIGLLTEGERDRVIHLVMRAGLPTRGPDWPTETYLEWMAHDKKAEAGEIRYIVLEGLGSARLSTASANQVDLALDRHREEQR